LPSGFSFLINSILASISLTIIFSKLGKNCLSMTMPSNENVDFTLPNVASSSKVISLRMLFCHMNDLSDLGSVILSILVRLNPANFSNVFGWV
ncbi:hypothetical protein, partial [Mycoplasmopsis bovis]|uniref:hypothetical protein n=1 Tax=Mycoplasmopsis bovis TaxID=28903 RepID=UPI003D282700